MSDCVLWTGGKISTGYGKKYLGAGKERTAHRWTWEQANGPIPDGLIVRHSCDVRLCVNLEHLLLGTQQDNVNDMIERGRHRNAHTSKIACPKCGGEYEVRPDGRRRCAPCKRAYDLNRYHEKMAS